jgi:hypothetical protein
MHGEYFFTYFQRIISIFLSGYLHISLLHLVLGVLNENGVYSSLEIRGGIFIKSMGARNRAGIGLSYRPAGLHRLAEFIPWGQFLGSISV